MEKQRHTPEVQAIHNDNKPNISASQSLASSAEKAMVSLDQRFRNLTLKKYATVEAAWKTWDCLSEPPGQLSRADFKVCLKMVDMTVTSKEKGTLRKMIDVSGSKLIRFSDVEAFMKGRTDADISLTPEKSQIASLPVNMPFLPENYSHRHDVEDRIRDLLVVGKTCKGNTVAAQGMGGVGKSCIKSAVIQTSAVRETFLDGIAWLSLVSLVR